MIADLKPYPEHQSTISSLLGSVPRHWRVIKLRSLVRPRNERNRPDLPLLSVARERGVFVRSGSGEENHNVIPDDLSNYKVAHKGDLVVNKMKAWQGSMGIAPCDGIVSPAYFVFRLAIEDVRYGQALLRSRPYVGLFAAASDGVRIGQWDLSIDGTKEIPLLLPPADEQAAIVRFLDYATGRLERAIRAKRKVIALLQEQKQVIIHRAVTRGLDPSVPLKPSGIPWLGDIPGHWEVQRLGQAIRLQTGFPFASSGFVQGGVGTRLLRGINVTPSGIRWSNAVEWPRRDADGLDEFALALGDVVLGMDRPIIGSGVRAAIIARDDTPSLLLQRVARLRPSGILNAEFLLLLLRGRQFRDYMAPIFTGISVPHLSPQQVKNFQVVLPPLVEQRAIVARLGADTRGVDIAMSGLAHEIDLLLELRTRLVADVVTGKLDVREAARNLPEDRCDGDKATLEEVPDQIDEEVVVE